LAYRTITFYGPSFQTILLCLTFVTSRLHCNTARQDPLPCVRNGYSLLRAHSLGYFPFVRHYSGNRYCFLFLGVLRWFTSPGVAPYTYVFSIGCRGIAAAGFPIRKSPDQSLLAAPRSLSQLRHVLHRLLTPRHPPEALSSLTKN
jgi:hypothetical protein